MDAEREIRAVGAISLVTGVLPRIAGVLVGATAIMYVLGWIEAESYYRTLGASWAVELLTPTQVMFRSAGLVQTFGLTLFMCIYYFLKGKGTRRWFIGLQLACYALSVLFFVCNLLPSSWLSPEQKAVALAASSHVYAVAAGLVVGELISTLGLTGKFDFSDYADAIHTLVFLGVLLGPLFLGEARAKIELSQWTSNYRAASIDGDAAAWHVVCVVGDKILVGQRLSDGAQKFRLLAADHIRSITSDARQ